jgi:hypothetical protein
MGGEAGVMGGEAGVMGGEAGVMGGEAGMMGGEAGVMGGEAGVMGGVEPPVEACLGNETFGLQSQPAPLSLGVDAQQSAPKLVSLAGGGYALTWLGAGEQGANYLFMQRLNAEREPQGEPHLFGRAKGGQYTLHATSSGVVVMWINQRSDILSSEALYLQSFDLEGAPRMEAPVMVEGSFSATYVSSAWTDALGGLLVYATPEGMMSQRFSLDGVGGESQEVTSVAARSPALVFNGAGWGAAWSERLADGRVAVYFQALGEDGSRAGAPKTYPDSKAQGAVKLAYGNGSYALAWSQPDPAVLSGEGRIVIGLRLLDDTGNELSAIALMEGEDNMKLSALSWLNPSLFMVTWHGFGGEQSTVGFSRVNTLGQALAPILVPAPEGSLYAEASVIGTASSAEVVMTLDPEPQITGLFSEASRLSITELAPCE